MFRSAVDDMVAAHTQLDAGESPVVLTQAPLNRMAILYDHDSNPGTASQGHLRLFDVVAADDAYDGSGRVDVRFGQGPSGEIYLLNKRNGVIYLVTNSLPPDVLCHGRTPTLLGRFGTPGDDVIIGSARK